MKDDLESNGMSRRLKLALQLFERVGAPAVFALLCFWFLNTTARDLTKAVDLNTRAFHEFSSFLVEFSHDVKESHSKMLEKLYENSYRNKSCLASTNQPWEYAVAPDPLPRVDVDLLYPVYPVNRYRSVEITNSGSFYAYATNICDAGEGCAK